MPPKPLAPSPRLSALRTSRSRRRPHARAAVFSVALLVGCNGSDDGLDVSEGCDIRARACQQAIFQRTAEVREQNGTPAPSVRTIDVQQLTDELQELVNEADDGEYRRWTAALQILGLLEPATGLDDALLATNADNIAAFYLEETRTVTVVDRGGAADPIGDVFLLAHEFVHALQHDTGHLSDFRSEWVDSTDSSVATTTLVEGEATVLAAGVIDRLSPTRSLKWGTLTSQIFDSTFALIEEADEPFVVALDSLPYALGARELAPAWRFEGGQAAIEPEYRAPRLSLIDWLESPYRPGDSRVQPLDCYPTRAPDNYTAVDHDTFGMAAVLALEIRAGTPAPSAWARAEDWENDSAVLYQSDDDNEAFAVAWRLRMGGSAEATGGRLALPPDTRVETEGQELVLFGATDPAVAEQWTDVTDCGTEDELPEAEDEAPPTMMANMP